MALFLGKSKRSFYGNLKKISAQLPVELVFVQQVSSNNLCLKEYVLLAL